MVSAIAVQKVGFPCSVHFYLLFHDQKQMLNFLQYFFFLFTPPDPPTRAITMIIIMVIIMSTIIIISINIIILNF